MVEARQLAERRRVAGNAAFKAKQYSEALSCYQQGLSSERTNMTLHANAAQAALKLNCYVQVCVPLCVCMCVRYPYLWSPLTVGEEWHGKKQAFLY